MLKLCPPRGPKHPHYVVRGSYLHVKRLYRSTGTAEKALARKFLLKWKAEIESGAFEPEPAGPNFATAMTSYIQAGGEQRFLNPLLEYFKARPLDKIKQADVDKAAEVLYPNGTPQTRNRQVYSPVAAILHHAGLNPGFRRPKGAASKPRQVYLVEDDAFRLLVAAEAMDARFGAFCTYLLYTGSRLSEGLKLDWRDINLADSVAFARDTKNGELRTVFLPEAAVAALANLPGDRKGRPFPWSKGRPLHNKLKKAAADAAVDLPGIAYHIFRHTYGAWMRRYAKLDTAGLVATGTWKSRDAAAVYEHVDFTEEAMKASLLPVRKRV